MTPDEHLQQHLELCNRIYLRLKAEGKWLWPDALAKPANRRHGQPKIKLN